MMAERIAHDPGNDPGIAWGVGLLPDDSARVVANLARRAEEAGFDRCWLYDEGLATRELYVCLTAVALATDRIRMGPGITNPYTRHPRTTASAIASLHELSDGRAFLGLGAGGSLALDPIGLARERPNRTIKETIEVCRALFRGAPVDFTGERLRLASACMEYGSPDIEIWVAGRGPRVLATGAELADGVSLDHIHEDFLSAEVERVRARGEAVGRTPQLAYSATIVTDERALERLRCHMTYRLVDSPPEVKEAIGLGPADSDAIQAAMAHGLATAAKLVRDEWVFPFVVHGTPAECAATIFDLCRRHRFSQFIVPAPDLEFAEETLDTAAEVMQALRTGPAAV